MRQMCRSRTGRSPGCARTRRTRSTIAGSTRHSTCSSEALLARPGICRPAGAASLLVDPRELDGLENLLAAVLRVVVEPRQRAYPVVEVGETDRCRIDVRMRVHERNRDLAGIGPFHLPSFA